MRVRRKVVWGALALAVPATTIAVFGTPGIFAGAAAPTFPVACTAKADLAFTPALTENGTHTTNRSAVTAVTVTSGLLKGCITGDSEGAPSKGVLTTVSAAIDIPAANLGHHTYATGYCPAFKPTDTTTLKALRGLELKVVWTGGEGGTSVFTVSSATAIPTSKAQEMAWVLQGKEVLGSYLEKTVNQLTLYFDTTTSAALLEGCSADQVVSSGAWDANTSSAMF